MTFSSKDSFSFSVSLNFILVREFELVTLMHHRSLIRGEVMSFYPFLMERGPGPLSGTAPNAQTRLIVTARVTWAWAAWLWTAWLRAARLWTATWFRTWIAAWIRAWARLTARIVAAIVPSAAC